MTVSRSIGDPMSDDLPHLDPTRPTAQRVAHLLGRMSLAEKVGQMMQLDAHGDLADLVLEKHVGSILHTSPARVLQAHELTARTRLRIPLLVGEDCIHGHSFFPGATIFPTQLGMAATWAPDLVERVARATAVEVAPTGVHWTFSPVLCIARDLRWGRIGETFGEDPFLIGELAAAMVRGYQGEDLADPTAVLATAKHFAGYSETQGGRDASEADLSRRKLRAWFLPPFERVAREGCRTFMLGYQSTDGVPITVNDWLLTDVLRGEWGWTGMLVTDWDNVGRMVWEQQVQPDHTHAAAAAVRAGNNMVMTTPQFFQGAQDAVAQGLLAESDLDDAVSRILALKFELGLFEDPRRPDVARQRAVIGSAPHTALNLEVAQRKNGAAAQRRGAPAGGRVPGRRHRPRPGRRRRFAYRRGRRPARRRRADPARRLGRLLRPGRLDARRPAPRHDHHDPRRPARARARRLDGDPAPRRRHPHHGARRRGRAVTTAQPSPQMSCPARRTER
ncbi:glycoside hydrolase family 3 protein [Micromonospora sp. ATCC 39149]|uniref:glycoside hydrolase family 3 protein n=1 Tax=Micromonospora sp. (strain ATCC 39149 / NRRL 15099 / SCC 1413) TaxID=219305 RepID=UPI0002D7E5DC|nr:glycoside hydrolase family 3 protein [Micromonospora sp. ATCC 39149]